MTDDAQSQAQRNANLARIRDNQRRSRARRKEYLQELEDKYRQCEQMGVEASAEIQAAARRVVEENKRLRQLLKQQGMTDAEIDSMQVDLSQNPQYPTAASALEGMLGVRKPCCASNSGGSDGSVSTADRRTSATSALAPPQAQHHYSGQRLSVTTSSGAGLHQFSSPHSSVSSSVPTPGNMHFPSTSAQNFALPAAANQPAMSYGGLHYDNSFGWQPHNHITEATASGTTSCYAAADAIRTMKPDIGYELEAELGCADGKECAVPNSQIFSIMERYADERN